MTKAVPNVNTPAYNVKFKPYNVPNVPQEPSDNQSQAVNVFPVIKNKLIILLNRKNFYRVL